MSTDINIEELDQAFRKIIQPLIDNASDTQRRRFARTVATRLRNNQAARIKAQQNPDGSAFAPRKSGNRNMFEKIRQRPHLRSVVNKQQIRVGFFGYIARIAGIHQGGKIGQVSPDLSVRYHRRELLGFSADDLKMIESLAIEQLTSD